MPFQPNDERINLSGRPKGSKNRTTKEIKEILTDFIVGDIDDLQKQYDMLPAREKLQFFEKVLKYIIPRQERTEMEGGSQIEFTQEDIQKLEGEIFTGRSERYSKEE